MTIAALSASSPVDMCIVMIGLQRLFSLFLEPVYSGVSAQRPLPSSLSIQRRVLFFVGTGT